MVKKKRKGGNFHLLKEKKSFNKPLKDKYRTFSFLCPLWESFSQNIVFFVVFFSILPDKNFYISASKVVALVCYRSYWTKRERIQRRRITETLDGANISFVAFFFF